MALETVLGPGIAVGHCQVELLMARAGRRGLPARRVVLASPRKGDAASVERLEALLEHWSVIFVEQSPAARGAGQAASVSTSSGSGDVLTH
jgi:hypothetical protein